MDAERLAPDDILPIKIRTRQVFSGSGETSLVQTVYCPARDRSVSLDTCRSCGHSEGAYEGPGESSVFCDDQSAGDVTLRQLRSGRSGREDPTPIADVMTVHVLCVRSDVSIEALRSLLIERKISGVPVVDARGAPIGVISKTDLVRRHYEDGDTGELEREPEREPERGFHSSTLARATVAELMTPVPVTFSEDASVAQVATAMAAERLHRLPIVGDDGTVVGIVSSLDLVAWYAQRDRHAPRARPATSKPSRRD